MKVISVKFAYKCLPGCRICANNQQCVIILHLTCNSSGFAGILEKKRRLV